MEKTFVTLTLGCKVNAYESDSIAKELIDNGYRYGEEGEKIHVALINTCSVTSSADQKSRQQIRRLANKYPEAILIVMGCYSQINDEIFKTIPEIDIALGTSKRSKILSYIKEFEKDGQKINAVDPKSRAFSYEELKATSSTKHARAYLKIQDGCDQFCTFCIIPLTRGKLRSRAKEDVVNEAIDLVSKGYQEIVLTGIHTGAYGVDLENESFTGLVKAILEACPTLYKLRISSIEGNQIDDELLSLMNNDERLARHLHIPLQAGSDEILKKMNRKYNKAEYLKIIQKVREVVADIAFTTDVIVGFPGESDELFNETKAFIAEVNFSELHVFPYSMRSRTPAATFPHHVDPAIKKARVHELIAQSKQQNDLYCQKFVGTKVSVLIEHYDEVSKTYKGHTSNYLPVSISSKEVLTHKVIDVIYDTEVINYDSV